MTTVSGGISYLRQLHSLTHDESNGKYSVPFILRHVVVFVLNAEHTIDLFKMHQKVLDT